MLHDISVRNYRVLRSLHIPQLTRINLISGLNNSGKTSLLEALFLWSGAGNPNIVMSPSIMRGMERFTAQEPEVLASMCWHPLFNSLDLQKKIDIAGYLSSHGYLRLSVASERQDILELPFSSADEAPLSTSLVLSFGSDRSNMSIVSKIHLGRENIRVEQSAESEIVLRSTFVSSHTGHSEGDAARLGQLRKQKQGHLVLEVMRAIDPRIESVQDSVAGGVPLIWIDIGLDEFVPLPTAGEGMNRIAQIVLAMANSRGGMVLIDEIENGIHHSVLSDLWEAIDKSSRYFDVQVFATTHSRECMVAAHYSLSSEDLRVHRLEVIDGETKCVTFEPTELAIGIEQDYELR